MNLTNTAFAAGPAAVLLTHPLLSFEIPTVNAECVFEQTATPFRYGRPEEVNIINSRTKGVCQICRVPVFKGERFKGYVPLPLQYQPVWLELSYYIILSTQMWNLWAEEERKSRRPRKQQAKILRKNSGALVAQHMISRLLALDLLLEYPMDHWIGEERVLILDEWKIRASRDWFNLSFERALAEGSKFLEADPTRPENKTFFGVFAIFVDLALATTYKVHVEQGWNIDEDNKDLLSPPDDQMMNWLKGEVEGLDDVFEETLKQEAYDALKKPGPYSYAQFRDTAVLPARWHEGHVPAPRFWGEKQWAWMAQGAIAVLCFAISHLTVVYLAGNNCRRQPFQLLAYCLTEDPPYTQLQQFTQVLDSLAYITITHPNWDPLHLIAKQLWFGEMTWREFVDDLIENHLDAHNVRSFDRVAKPDDPANTYNTLEVRLVLEGYVRRHDLDEDEEWDVNDQVLWQALSRVASGKNDKKVWEGIILKITSGRKVTDVLKAAKPNKKTSKSAGKKSVRNAHQKQARADEEGSAASEQQASAGPSGHDADTRMERNIEGSRS
ncbi:hypothetical protein DEU56DRAFT_918172 [Suillus clintonianus]|uniref:uncharacterized protein n=1 Tax=Suillus clintonianus TaxID=1904413 RepID=UPI001B886231|nr:uncharacterized protein DEU56DRAFT_918172 [Suillus clintonianus]KAG2121486.1 hypothetical protein DEU56DRAFT_918172 [Suillus clintonianus]